MRHTRKVCVGWKKGGKKGERGEREGKGAGEGRLTFKLLEKEGGKRKPQKMEGQRCYNLRFIKGATHLVVGPSGSGKTFRTCEILEHKNELLEGGAGIKNIVFCYAAWQPCYEKLRRSGAVTRFVPKMPSSSEFVELVKDYKERGGSIVVIDDFMSKIDENLVDIVTVQSRHHNTSTFILFQSLFPPNKLARQISLNVKYIHAHKNPRENAQIQVLARQVSPKDYKWIVAAYHKVTEVPYQCLLFDLTQEREEHLRFRSNYLPREWPMRAWLPAGALAGASI